MPASGNNAIEYDTLKNRLGIKTPTKIHDAMQVLAAVELFPAQAMFIWLSSIGVSCIRPDATRCCKWPCVMASICEQ